jgi:hypothetical protein
MVTISEETITESEEFLDANIDDFEVSLVADEIVNEYKSILLKYVTADVAEDDGELYYDIAALVDEVVGILFDAMSIDIDDKEHKEVFMRTAIATIVHMFVSLPYGDTIPKNKIEAYVSEMFNVALVHPEQLDGFNDLDEDSVSTMKILQEIITSHELDYQNI